MDFSVIQECGERLLKIEIIDDCDGMEDVKYGRNLSKAYTDLDEMMTDL